jgi:hypothetical protein
MPFMHLADDFFGVVFLPVAKDARVVKLVDTGDLKSPAYCRRAGSIPAPGTNTLSP